MMNLNAKICTIIKTALAFMCLTIANVQAQDKIKPLSVSEFATTVAAGGSLEAWVRKNLNDDGTEILYCGTTVCPANNRCIQTSFSYADNATQITDSAMEAGAATAAVGVAASATGVGVIAGAPTAALGAVVGGIGAGFQLIRGRGTITVITYKCHPQEAALPKGYQEAPEGGYNKRIKVVSGGLRGLFAGDKVKEDATDGCKTDGNGHLYCFQRINGISSLTYADAGTAIKGCEVLPVKLFNMRNCFFCSLVAVIYDASAKMPALSFEKLAGAFATLIALGLAIWIAIQTLTHVSSLTKQDAPKFLAGLIKQSYKFLIAFLLLQNSSQLFQRGIVPILDAGIHFGQALLPDNASVSLTGAMNRMEEISSDPENMDKVLSGSESRKDPYTSSLVRALKVTKNTYYPQDLYLKLDVFITNVQSEIAFMQAVGSSLICIGSGSMIGQNSGKSLLKSFQVGFLMMLQGLIFAAFGFLLSISFAFYMIDAIVQLGIVGALMPFLIASWPFKVTSQYAGTGFKMLLNSAFIFVFIGLVINVNIELINAAIGNTAADNNASASSYGGLQDIAIAINSQNIDELFKLTDISAMGFLILIFCCIFGFKFMGQTSSLAGQFSSGGIKPTAPSIATMGASAALSGAKKVSKPVREAIGRKAEDAEMAVVGAIAHPIKTAKSIGRGVRNIFRGKKGGGDSGEGGSESETETESKKKGSSTTTESSTKKKSPVVGQKGEKTDKTENSQPGNGPKVGQKSDTNGKVEAENKGDASENREENKVDNNAESSTTSAENGTSENASSENSGDSVQPQKPHAQQQTTSQNQRRYKRKKDRGRMQKNKQRRNYGKRHK